MSVLNEKHRPVRAIFNHTTEEGTQLEVSVQKTDGGARIYLRLIYASDRVPYQERAERSYLYRWSVQEMSCITPSDSKEKIPQWVDDLIQERLEIRDVVKFIWND